MKVTIIGTGNVATVLGQLIMANGHTITEVLGRDKRAANNLARRLHARPVHRASDLAGGNELYLLAISDDSIQEVATSIPLTNELIVHTAGAVGLQVLSNASPNHGVLYPLQSLRSEGKHIPHIPLLFDASNERSNKQLRRFAATLSTEVRHANDVTRLKYHLNGVLVNNFTNLLYQLSKDYCDRETLSFPLLYPLLLETATRISDGNPAGWQTGPATRGDKQTMLRHLQLIGDDTGLKKIYKDCSAEIMSRTKKPTGNFPAGNIAGKG